MSNLRDQIIEKSLLDFETFINLVAPHRILGQVHKELIAWIQRTERKKNLLVLLPRDHMKSAIAAYYAAWRLTKDPTIRILIISSTANLAEKQLKFIKDILVSDVYTKYFPDYIHPDEGKREKWSATEISIDHPSRRSEGIRDPTVFTGGLTTSLTGLHCDLALLDDVVVYENAYTDEGRNKVYSQYSLLNSIAGAESEKIAVGTRYHPKDLYGELQNIQYELLDEFGDIQSKEPLYEIFERQVEDQGDGFGNFLWPRQQRKDGKWFGFNAQILAIKRAEYLDKRQFRAQYYNDPNDLTDAPIPRSKFQYFDPKFLQKLSGVWCFKGRRLNIYAAIDFAFSAKARSDWTAIVVIGIDSEKQIYILDLKRIKTNRISDYYQLIVEMHTKWELRKLKVETVVAQAAIVKELKESYLKPNGMMISLDETPTSTRNSKQERMAAILEPRYDNLMVWHPSVGIIGDLEEELTMRDPPHDDLKDALASAISIAVPPVNAMRSLVKRERVQYNHKFGGLG